VKLPAIQSTTAAEGNLFRFRSVVFLTCGLEADKQVCLSGFIFTGGTLPDRRLQSGLTSLITPSKIPTGHGVQVAIQKGLGITSTSERDLFELNRDGNLLDMNSFLRKHLSPLFDYFAKRNPWILTVDHSTWTDGDRRWPYVLLARDGRSLVPAVLNGHDDPTISDFRDNSGRKTCRDSERVVFIGEISLRRHKTVMYIIPNHAGLQPQSEKSPPRRPASGKNRRQTSVCLSLE